MRIISRTGESFYIDSSGHSMPLLDKLINKVIVFGMHFASLDIRQDSSVHHSVLEAIAEKENIEDKTFRVKTEIAFHGKLYEITGNDTLKRFQIMLMPIFGYVTTLEEKATRGKVSHKDLVEILKHGNKDDFRAGMFEHLKPHFDRLMSKRAESK